MILDHKEGELILKIENDSLKIRHKSQLNLWGFKENSIGISAISNNGELISKLINYFEENGFSISLTKSCSKIFSENNKKKDQFNKLRDLLKDYKNGLIDVSEYKNHINSLKDISRKLKDHQIKASLHLYKAGNSANFSVPGSGKTAVVYAVYQRLKKEDKVDAIFVVGPLSCFGSWESEYISVFSKDPDISIFAGGNLITRKEKYYKKKYSELNLSTFQTVSRDYSEIPKLLSNARIMLVIDEAHYIKQLGGEWSSAVLSLSAYASYRVVLTGTPIPKSYTDFYNIFDFLYPEIPVISNSEKIKIRQFENNNDTESATQLLDKTIGPLFYRVRKSELNLEEQIFHEPIIVTMNTNEKIIYDAIITKIINYSKNDYCKNIEYIKKLIIGRMMRLRQCYSNVGLLEKTIEEYDEDLLEKDFHLKKLVYSYNKSEKPAKLEKLMELVKNFILKDKKILIWSNFIGTIKLIQKEIEEAGYRCEKIIGETPTNNNNYKEELTRDEIRKEFVDKNSGLKILLANPAACAESISLHKSCNNAIYYDLSYNCSQYLQSLDRIHRVGGSENIPSHYFFLQYQDTYEFQILANLREKASKMMSIIDKDYEIYNLDMFDSDDEIDAYHELIKSW